MIKTRRFLDSPELYDMLFSFKEYADECGRLRRMIDELVPEAHSILDVACGTGEHARFLKEYYAVDGIDINESYLEAARLKNPSGNYSLADMMDFELGRTYDVVTCLFSAVGIVGTYDRLERAIACMARHVRLGGVLIIEPWFSPEQWRAGRQLILAGVIGADKVYRLSIGVAHEQLSVLVYNYLHCTPVGIDYYNEQIELGLFTRDEMTWALEFAGLDVKYDTVGLMGRGLYFGRRIS